MARSKQKKDKDPKLCAKHARQEARQAKIARKRAKAAAKAESLYGTLPFKLRSHDKPKSDTGIISSKRKKNKQEPAAKKPSSTKVKAETKHHVAKFSRHSIKQRINAAADLRQSNGSDSHGDKRFGTFNLGRPPPRQRKRRRGKKPERIEFQMNIPDGNHEYFLRPHNVPWFKAEEQERFRENVTAVPDGKVGALKINRCEAAESNDDEILQLPSNQVLSQIDAEIQSFSAYVKLTPSERKARDAFLSHITDILTTQFANGGKGRRQQKNGDGDDEIYVEPFGSYATQEVCTFASDVDMCLWGLVKEEEKPTHLKFVSSDSNETDAVEDTSCFLNDQRGECPLLTESSLLRTMDAIQSAQTKSIVQKYDDRKIAVVDEKVVADECLFVIDRTGVGMDSVKEKADVDPNNIDVEKQSLDSDAQNEAKTISINAQTKKAKSKNSNATKEQFEFVIDRDGVAELGGDFADLPTHDEPKDQIEERLSQERPADGSVEQTRKLGVTDRDTRESPNKDTTVETTSAGKSYEKAINIADDSSDEEVIAVDDASSDEADKLDSFYSRQISNGSNKAVDNLPHTSEGNERSRSTDPSATSSYRENDVISVCDSSDESERDFNESSREEVLELSITSNATEHSTDAPKPIVKPVFGPTGKTRIRIVSVLQGLTSHLRRSSFTNTVECRSRARVPIVNCNTRTGFEGDIAIGGHNGMDTSTYAQTQVGRFFSFAPIVLVLKVLMVQQGLDKPFTGGLGSYKLYVLVAHHIETHLANGGNDRPSEILISILFRYSCVGSVNDAATTDLESVRNGEGLIASGDGVCDLAPVFRIPDIVEMFRECHERLFDRILLVEGFDDDKSSANLSYLSSMIDCFRLKEARESSDKRSRLSDDITRPIGRDHPGKVSNSRRIGKVFSKNEHPSNPKRPIPTSFLDSNKKRRSFNDPPFNSQQAKRGPRGGLIPLHRPDVIAAKSLRADPEKELLLRGTKNRKNKKKQMRDDALRVFSRRSL